MVEEAGEDPVQDPRARIGQAAARSDRGERLAGKGVACLEPAEAFRFDLAALAQTEAAAAASPLLSELAIRRSGNARVREERGAFRRVLEGSVSGKPRRRLLEANLRDRIGRVLRADPASIDPERPFKSMGFDSLMALELRIFLESSLGLTLSATLVWN